MSYAPRGFLVDGPQGLEKPCYGLFSVVPPGSIEDPHWMASGIEWETVLCNASSNGIIDECPPVSGFTKNVERGLEFCHADPFVVYDGFECSPVGRNIDEAFEIARKRLTAWEQREVERVFWTGAGVNGTVNPSLASGNSECAISPVILGSGTQFSPAEAIYQFEQALADVVACGAVIHIPSGAEAFFVAQRLITMQDGVWVTSGGLQVVIGSGYPETGPSGAAPAAGATWLFATGPMVAVRSDVFVYSPDNNENINKSVNTIEVRAERFYAVGYSCANFALEMTLSCAC